MPEWTCLVCDPPAVIPYAKRASSTAVWRGHCARVHPDGTTLRSARERERYLRFYDAKDIIDLKNRPNYGVGW